MTVECLLACLELVLEREPLYFIARVVNRLKVLAEEDAWIEEVVEVC